MFKFDPAFRAEFRDNWRVLLIAFSCLLFGFSAPAFSLPFLFTEVISEFGWTREQATLLASAKYLTGAASALLVGRILDITGVRAALIVTLGLGGLALVSFLWIPNLESYYLVGMLMGLAGPGAMVAVKVLVSRNFHSSQGTATGVALMGTSLGSIIVPVVVSVMISHLGWRIAFASLSLGIWLVALPMLLFFFPSPSPGSTPYIAQGPLTGGKRARTGLAEAATMMRRGSFWLLAASLFIGAAVDQAFIQHQVLIFRDINMSREAAAMAISAIGAVGVGCRILVGNILDSKSNKGLSALYLLLTVTSLVAFYLVNPFILIAFVALRAAGHAAILIDVNVMTKHVFGLRNFGTMMGIYTAIVSLGFATGPWIMGRLYQVNGNYDAAFWLFALLPIVGAVLVWFLKPTFWIAGLRAAGPSETPANTNRP